MAALQLYTYMGVYVRWYHCICCGGGGGEMKANNTTH